MNKDEIVLLYGFNSGRSEKIAEVLKSIRIRVKLLKDADYNEKIGFLVGAKGFGKSSEVANDALSGELMIFHNIKGKRLDFTLDRLRSSECEIPKYKAVVTPFNIHWSLKKLYDTMEKEHGKLR